MYFLHKIARLLCLKKEVLRSESIKKDDSVHICSAFWKINQISHETICSIPHTGDLITKVAGHKFYSKIDLRNAYLQILDGDESHKF